MLTCQRDLYVFLTEESVDIDKLEQPLMKLGGLVKKFCFHSSFCYFYFITLPNCVYVNYGTIHAVLLQWTQ